MTQKKPRRNCLSCGRECSRPEKFYCGMQCHRDYEYKEYIQRWLSGVESGMNTDGTCKNSIRRWLFERAGAVCEQCKWGTLNKYTNTLPLHIHHKDGNSDNNLPENLILLCPNCHSLEAIPRNRDTVRKKYHRASVVRNHSSKEE